MTRRATTAIAVLVSLFALASVACAATGPTAGPALPAATATPTATPAATATPAGPAPTAPTSVSATPVTTTPGAATPVATPPVDATTLADGETVVVLAPVESVALVIFEMDPPQYTLRIASGLPSGCARFNGYESAIDGNAITVTVTNVMPAGDAICTAIYGLYEGEVVLGRDFTSGEIYTVTVNGELVETFTAQ